jgi:sugar lactone lactonase YvrE
MRRIALVTCVAAAVLAPAADGRSPRPPPKVVTKGNVRVFATDFERTFTGALGLLFPRLRALRPSAGGQARRVSLRLRGKRGAIRVAGFGLLQPAPARFELTLSFGSFSPASTGKAKSKLPVPSLGLRGAVQFNFVTPRRGNTTIPLGLFRGFLHLSGAFRGTAEVYGEVESGKLVALVVTSGGRRLRVGPHEPRQLVSWTSTVAGSGKRGFRDGPGRSARFSRLTGVAVARDGQIFAADTENDAVRQISPSGMVRTLVRGIRRPSDLAVDGLGTLVVSADSQDTPLARVVIGGPARGALIPVIGAVGKEAGGLPHCQGSCDGFTPLASLLVPTGIDVHGGIVYVAQNERPPALRLVTLQGSIHTLRDLRGSCGLVGVGGPSDVAKGLNGDLYFVAPLPGCYAVFALHPDGTFGVVAGMPRRGGARDGNGAAARFFNPKSLGFDGARYLYVSDTGNNLIRRVDVLTGEVVRVAGCVSHRLCRNSFGFRAGPADLAQFANPNGIALDAWGDLYVADLDNESVRLVRVVTDPERDPQILRFEPYTVQRGAHARVTVTGRNLGLTERVSLGGGVQIRVLSQSSRELDLDVRVADTAPTGTHRLTVTTFYGSVQSPPGLSLQVLDQNGRAAGVSTIAGTGAWSPGVHDGPAEKAQFALPSGIAAIDATRVLVADPLEQRIRFLGTKEGTARELIDLALNNSGTSAALSSLLGGLGPVGQILNSLGITAYVMKATEDVLRPLVTKAIDQLCADASSPCNWIELPWAGTALTPGNTQGLRLTARMFLPVDVATSSDPDVFFAADTGNRRARPVGIDPRRDPQKAKQALFDLSGADDRPFAVADGGDNTLLAAEPGRSKIVRIALRNGGTPSQFAGVDGSPGCEPRSGAPRHPLGLPLGMAGTKDDLYVADPFCDTVWKIAKKDGAVKDMRGPFAGLGASSGPCVDGPVAFATFGAPTDVTVDADGNIWVADTGCNSIRELKDVWADKEAGFIGGSLRRLLGGLSGHLPKSTVGKIQGAIDSLQPDFIEANRFWVLTVAGSPEGLPGFRDGPAADARFFGPVGVAVARSGKVDDVFVSDAGNRRVRLLSVPIG